MDVVFLSPHYPPDMVHFTRGLAEVGARIRAVGDVPLDQVPETVRRHLTGYLQVSSWQDLGHAAEEIERWIRGTHVDRVETLWEPLVLLAAEVLGDSRSWRPPTARVLCLCGIESLPEQRMSAGGDGQPGDGACDRLARYAS